MKFNKILQLKIKKKITEVGPKSLSYDKIYNLIINFNPEIDNYLPTWNVYLHYSLDKINAV